MVSSPYTHCPWNHVLMMLCLQDWLKRVNTLLRSMTRCKLQKLSAANCRRRFRTSKTASTGTQMTSDGKKQVPSFAFFSSGPDHVLSYSTKWLKAAGTIELSCRKRQRVGCVFCSLGKSGVHTGVQAESCEASCRHIQRTAGLGVQKRCGIIFPSPQQCAGTCIPSCALRAPCMDAFSWPGHSFGL